TGREARQALQGPLVGVRAGLRAGQRSRLALELRAALLLEIAARLVEARVDADVDERRAAGAGEQRRGLQIELAADAGALQASRGRDAVGEARVELVHAGGEPH